MKLVAHNISAGYGSRPVLHDVSLKLGDGAFTGILGPNGSGKSTLLKVLGGLLRPTGGAVWLDDDDVHAMGRRRLARRLALLPQHPVAPAGLGVRQLVAYGRYPYIARFGKFGDTDRRIISDVMQRCELNNLAERPAGELSGGERQRAWIAMALAQQPRVLLLDEPLSHLDINHQLEVMDLLQQFNRDHALTVAIVLHDINLAARFCDRLAVIREGRLGAGGATAEVLAGDVIDRTFGVTKHLIPAPAGDTAFCHFVRAAPGPVAAEVQ